MPNEKDTIPEMQVIRESIYEAFEKLGDTLSVTEMDNEVARIIESKTGTYPTPIGKLKRFCADIRTRQKDSEFIEKLGNAKWKITEKGKTEWLGNETSVVAAQKSGNSKVTNNLVSSQTVNLILYGPPGTGKTYESVFEAVRICNELDAEEAEELKHDRDQIMKKYHELSDQGRVEFVTFHQSFSYEDFVEGLRPVTNEVNEKSKKSTGGFSLKPHAGIFKRICVRARKNLQKIDFKGKRLIPLCENNPRRLGAHGWHSYEILLEHRENGILYEDYLEKGGRRKDLDWDYKKDWVSVERVSTVGDSDDLAQNYVLIIDEINRANISKVFGELITLLEVDKRIGARNEIQLRLPYSGKSFGVPKNLHIIGTMNTADRSIALLDIALRRRFKFKELMPDTNFRIFNEIEIGKNGNVSKLMGKINRRITYLYDREHQIGHAYFLKCETESDVADVFRNEIIPLLAEYFFEDREKIAKVLEDNLIDENGKLVGCFFEGEKISPKIIDLEEEWVESEAKWLWTVKEKFEFDRLEFS